MDLVLEPMFRLVDNCAEVVFGNPPQRLSAYVTQVAAKKTWNIRPREISDVAVGGIVQELTFGCGDDSSIISTNGYELCDQTLNTRFRECCNDCR